MEPALGWRVDPYATHELRYFTDGEPTPWVCTGGKIALETVATGPDFVVTPDDPSETTPVEPFGIGPASDAPVPERPTPADGWRSDPVGSHEFRYYEGGVPTSWVATAGRVSEELVVTPDEFLQAIFPDPSAPGGVPPAEEGLAPVATSATSPTAGPDVLEGFLRSVDVAPLRPTAAPEPETLQAWSIADGDPWAVESPDCREADGSETSGPAPIGPQPPHPERRRAAGWRTRRLTVVACAAGALALVTSLAAFAATNGTGQPSRSGAGNPSTAPRVAPPTGPSTATRSGTPAAAPAAGNPTAAWWIATGQPDTNRVQVDLQTMSSRTGNPGALAVSCEAFSSDAATVASAPAPPTPSIERQWQLTMAKLTKVTHACGAGKYSHLPADLRLASRTIHDLSAQVVSYLR